MEERIIGCLVGSAFLIGGGDAFTTSGADFLLALGAVANGGGAEGLRVLAEVGLQADRLGAYTMPRPWDKGETHENGQEIGLRDRYRGAALRAFPRRLRELVVEREQMSLFGGFWTALHEVIATQDGKLLVESRVVDVFGVFIHFDDLFLPSLGEEDACRKNACGVRLRCKRQPLYTTAEAVPGHRPRRVALIAFGQSPEG